MKSGIVGLGASGEGEGKGGALLFEHAGRMNRKPGRIISETDRMDTGLAGLHLQPKRMNRKPGRLNRDRDRMDNNGDRM